MPVSRTVAVLLGVVGLLAAERAQAGGEPGAGRGLAHEIEDDLVRTVGRIRRETVSILTKREGGARTAGALARPQPLKAVGSGVLVHARGQVWVLTNFHVVDVPGRLEAVTIDGTAHAVHVHEQDAEADLALLAFDHTPEGLVGQDLGRRPPSAASRAGSWVLAVGNPFFLALDGDGAASLGVVSGTRPAGQGSYIDGPTLQHDAEINPGSSGGPLWTASGDLLGLNGTIATRSRAQGAGPSYTGASFSVPLERVYAFVAGSPSPPPPPPRSRPVPGHQAEAPRVVRSAPGFLGIRYQTEVGRSGGPEGARITGVISPSPVAPRGAAAGVQPGDVITRFSTGGRTYVIRTAEDVNQVLSGLGPGTAVSLRLTRSGRTLGWAGRLAAR